MNPSVIESDYPRDDPTFKYLEELARRVEKILGSRTIDAPFARALRSFLIVHELRFDDGFVANSVTDFDRILWNKDAELIVRSLAEDLPRNWELPIDSEPVMERLDREVADIFGRSPGIVRVGGK